MGGIGISLNHNLLGAQLRCPVQIDGINRFVGRKSKHFRHSAVDGGINDVLRTQHVGLNGLERVVFTGGHLLHCRGVHDDVCASRRSHEAITISDVADEVADASVAELLMKLPLLQFIPRKPTYVYCIRPGRGHPPQEGLAE